MPQNSHLFSFRSIVVVGDGGSHPIFHGTNSKWPSSYTSHLSPVYKPAHNTVKHAFWATAATAGRLYPVAVIPWRRLLCSHGQRTRAPSSLLKSAVKQKLFYTSWNLKRGISWHTGVLITCELGNAGAALAAWDTRYLALCCNKQQQDLGRCYEHQKQTPLPIHEFTQLASTPESRQQPGLLGSVLPQASAVNSSLKRLMHTNCTK